jgi:trans-aconitate 2-methyltransferase
VSPARDWDARSYDRISGPMEALGREVLDRLQLQGDETVLDAGCGTGRVTEALIERLPRGHVIGVDGSPEMISAARERLGPGPDLRVADLLDLALDEPVDAVLSTATFHWIADHARLFARLHAALRPGGALVAQCGGIGNVAAVHAAAQAAGAEEPYAAHLAGWQGPWNFSPPDLAAVRLEEAGFHAVHAWLQARPVVPDEPLEYLRTIVLGAHLERLPAELAESFTAAVAARLGDPLTIDYVRLNLDAVA